MHRVLARILAVAVVATAFMAVGSPAFANGTIPFNPPDCQGYTGTHIPPTGNTTIITAGGATITDLAIHDGNASPLLPENQCYQFTTDGSFVSPVGHNCYTVSGLGTATVTVTQSPQQDCGGISFIQINTGTVTTTTTGTTTTTTTTTSPGATPELDSFVLFGVGVLGMAGYALYKRRRGLPMS